jgi:hypothetical protein
MKLTPLCLLGLVIPLMTSCASDRVGIPDHQVVRTGSETSRPTGYLQVFTATDARPDGDSTYGYPHSGYTIYDQDGKVVRYIRNHLGRMDGVPTVIPIPAGSYQIQADAEHYGRVTFPIEIIAGRTSVVHLEAELKQSEAPHPNSQLVRLPSGQVVGWREPAE